VADSGWSSSCCALHFVLLLLWSQRTPLRTTFLSRTRRSHAGSYWQPRTRMGPSQMWRPRISPSRHFNFWTQKCLIRKRYVPGRRELYKQQQRYPRFRTRSVWPKRSDVERKQVQRLCIFLRADWGATPSWKFTSLYLGWPLLKKIGTPTSQKTCQAWLRRFMH